LIPTFFVTVACGIVSGFHSTQATLIARSVSNEKEGKTTFYNIILFFYYKVNCNHCKCKYGNSLITPREVSPQYIKSRST
ncbi:hypothetical protein, partial [Clostridioides difficile]|uniref:hypothetical protein n=1 Tax=Clostridioides difficile TaxID=1496 RepID=UPI002ED066D6